ncbi:MAG: MoaD/ThiS family protein [Bacteroidetes bacterium]|nr:MoaD/ThiS family protein [Bacteroidota bacterium]
MNATIQIMAFGKVAEIIGSVNFTMQHIASTNLLKEYLLQLFPELSKVKFAMAVNKKLITTDTAIDVSANIALLPPFSGG